jgi:hypothetical protein
MDEQARINKDIVTKFKVINKILEDIDGRVMEVESSNHQMLNTMKILEAQLGRLVGCLIVIEEKWRRLHRRHAISITYLPTSMR